MKYRTEIDGLRAIAVGGVLLCHFRTPWFTGGYAGVDVFFVISGYLITGQIVREIGQGLFSFASFYQRRVRRIFPALTAVICSTIIIESLFFSPNRLRELGVSSIAALLSVSNILFWSQQGYFDVSAALKPLLHTWSLGVEEQFYLLWPLLLFTLPASPKAYIRTLLLLLISSLAANVLCKGHTSSIFFLLPFRVFEFCIGALTATLQWKVSRFAYAFTAVGLGMIVVSYLIFDEATGFPSFPALLPCFGAALVILGGSNQTSKLTLSNASMGYLGSRSYSLYLVHWPIAVVYTYLAAAPWTWKTGVWLAVASIGLAELLYRGVEEPFRYPFRGASIDNHVFSRGMVAVWVAALVLAAASLPSGWVWRLGDQASEYALSSSSPAGNYGGDGCGNGCETHPNKPLVAYVVGDSNAQQYYSEVKAQFPDHNFRFFHFSSCPFFSIEYTRDFSEHADPALYDRGCRAARLAAFEEIRRAPAAVLVSQIWVSFPLVSEKTGVRLKFSSLSAAASFYADQLSLLAELLGAKSLLVFGSIPGAPDNQQDVVDCLFRPIHLQNNCELSSPDPRRKMGNVRLSAALGDRGIFMDPFDVLCKGEKCRLIDGAVPIYSDANHLTQHGTKLVLVHFRDAFRSVIFSSEENDSSKLPSRRR